MYIVIQGFHITTIYLVTLGGIKIKKLFLTHKFLLLELAILILISLTPLFWFQKAPEAGNVMGQNNFGWCYRNGRGVSVNHDKAIFLVSKSC